MRPGTFGMDPHSSSLRYRSSSRPASPLHTPRGHSLCSSLLLHLLVTVLFVCPPLGLCANGNGHRLSANERDSKPVDPANGFLETALSAVTPQLSQHRRLTAKQPAFERARNYTDMDCQQYERTYAQIEHDLKIHRKLGTSLNSTKFFAYKYGKPDWRGMTVGFFRGQAYLLRPTNFRVLRHHAPLHLSYIRQLLYLQDTFGRAIPDVVFVVVTSDTPRYVSPLLVNTSSTATNASALLPFTAVEPNFVPGPYPVLGYCKSDFWPDLMLVPCYHFHGKLYDNTSLRLIPSYNLQPWEERKGILFGRFSSYLSNRAATDPFTFKEGLGGEQICESGNRSCPLREHFMTRVAPKFRPKLDVSLHGRVPLLEHTRYKYLLSLDGQGVSSRLEQLLPMGSVVVKQQSGYYAYYYRMLRHRVNILEFWRQRPEDVDEELQWALRHDEQAERIAAAGQRLAAKYLTGNGRACYWYRLLHGLKSTLTYTPKLSQWRKAKLLRAVLDQDLPSTPEGKKLYSLPWGP